MNLPGEVVAEIAPGHAVVALWGKSRPHFHNHTTETYHLLEGHVAVVIKGDAHRMESRFDYLVPWHAVHYAVNLDTERGFSLIEVDSSPAWDPADHILV